MKMIQDKCPDQLKLLFALWTRIAVQQLIKKLWQIDMPIRTGGEYLNRWGFRPQKTFRKAYEQNPNAVKKRINLISSVTNQGKVRFLIYKDTMNAKTFLKFVKRLIGDATQKIFLILDNLRVHHSYVVKHM